MAIDDDNTLRSFTITTPSLRLRIVEDYSRAVQVLREQLPAGYTVERPWWYVFTDKLCRIRW